MREGRRERVHRVRGEPDRGDDDQEGKEPRVVSQQAERIAEARRLPGRSLLGPRPDREQRADEDEVRERVEQERGRDPEVLDRRGTERGADRAGEVVRHRVQRDGGRQALPVDERGDQRLLRRDRRRARHAEPEREEDHDPGRGETRPREHGKDRCQRGRSRLRREQEPPPVEAVGRAAGPRHEHEDRDELAEVEQPEQERRVRQPVDEQRRGEVLEPPAARRERVAEEVRPEVSLPNKGKRGAGTGRRAHPGLLSVLLPAMQSFFFPGRSR